MIGDTARQRQPIDEDLEYLRVESIQRVALAVAIGALGFLGVGIFEPALIEPRMGLVAAALAASAFAGWQLCDRFYNAAALLLIAGLFCSVTIATAVYSAHHVIFALPLVTFIVPLLLGERPTVVAVAGGSSLVWAMRHFGIGEISQSDALTAYVLLIASAVLSWIVHQPLRTTLRWAWASYVKELNKTREVRERQAELAQISKNLADACEHLEQANRALSQARRAAEEARRLKDEFATAISHELRTPLNLIIGFSEMVVRSAAAGGSSNLSADLRTDFETIYRNACHLSDLVEDVLDLGQMDARRLILQKRWSDLSSILEDAVTAVSGLYRKAGLSITVDLPPGLPLLNVDPTRVRQILINLLTNAVRYTDEGGARVSAHLDGHDVVVSVSDTGVGIPPEDLPYVFESFRQTGQLKRRGGFGLGLTVSKRFAEMHGGSMWVVSEPNRGSTFSFSLPTLDNVATVPANLSLRRLETRHDDAGFDGVVLVLDRDVGAADVLRRHLGEYRVIAATSPHQVARLASHESISTVVVTNPDVTLDDALARAARSHLPDVPVLRCSVRTLGRAGREIGAVALLSKPVCLGKLRKTLRRLKLRPRLVLIVDDDEWMVRLLAEMIQVISPRCRVQTATSADRGLALAKDEPPDLVFLDLLMPEVNGYAFLRAWKCDPLLCAIPVIVVSAAVEQNGQLALGDSLEFYRPGGIRLGDLLRATRVAIDAAPSLSSPSAENHGTHQGDRAD